MNKCAIDIKHIIGKPFETTFEVVDRHSGELQVVEDPRLLLTKEFLEEFKEDEDGDAAEGKDNRDIQNNDVAQALNQDEIEQLKKSYKGHEEIIKAMKEGSATWDKRTKFSQEKWMKKKLAKYQVVFTVKKPSALTLCEMYHATGP